MFGLLKSKNLYTHQTKDVYGVLLLHIRNPAFYDEYGVPDSFDGRFDLLLVHVYAVIEYVLENAPAHKAAEDFNQALFDAMFADMDQTLREMGIGDMGIPKHMRRMMKAFNGRVHAYSAAAEGAEFKTPLRQNVYGTVEAVDEQALNLMNEYIIRLRSFIREHNVIESVMSGQVRLPEPDKTEG